MQVSQNSSKLRNVFSIYWLTKRNKITKLSKCYVEGGDAIEKTTPSQ